MKIRSLLSTLSLLSLGWAGMLGAEEPSHRVPTIAEQIASGRLSLTGSPEVVARIRTQTAARRLEAEALRGLGEETRRQVARLHDPVLRARERTLVFPDGKGGVYAHGSLVAPGLAVAKSSEVRGSHGRCRLLVEESGVDGDGGAEFTFQALRRSAEDDLVLLRVDQGSLSGVGAMTLPGEPAAPGQFVFASTAFQPSVQAVVSVAARPLHGMAGTNLASSVHAFERKMELRLSRRRTGFVSAVETDLNVVPEACGGPVVDLEGRFAGMILARAARHSTLVLPASRIRELLVGWGTSVGLME